MKNNRSASARKALPFFPNLFARTPHSPNLVNAVINISPTPWINALGWLIGLVVACGIVVINSETHNDLAPTILYITLLLMAASLVTSLLLHNLWRLLKRPSPWPRLFLLSISWTSGIATATTGQRVRANVFYAANHHSWIDIPVMSGVTGCTFVANDGIAGWPLIGWLCKINNTIFVSRENRASVGNQVEDLRAAMTGDQPVTIFPEGTTHDGSGLLPFKPSLFAALVPPPSGMLVQPVFLSYGHHTPRVAWVGDEKVTENFWRLLSYLKPITAT